MTTESETQTKRGKLWWLDKACSMVIVTVAFSLGGYAIEQEFGLFRGYGLLMTATALFAYWWLNVARPVIYDA